MFDFASMNETDVREAILRPFIEKLGYKYGTNANIRTEVPLRYDRMVLGHKNPEKDPVLKGRADYVCDAVPYGRWVLEAKRGNVEISEDDVIQAHSYCAHYDIAATHFLISNGSKFKLYAFNNTKEPFIEWNYDETEDLFQYIYNILSYDAFKMRSKILEPAREKPLGPHISAQIELLGGGIEYGEHTSDHPLFQGNPLVGVFGAVRGGYVKRNPDGMLEAFVDVMGSTPGVTALQRQVGIEGYRFYSPDEFISVRKDRPTIFQNITKMKIPAGSKIIPAPGLQEMVIPITVSGNTFTQATGYVEGHQFVGVASFEHVFEIEGVLEGADPNFVRFLDGLPKRAFIEGAGKFEINFRNL